MTAQLAWLLDASVVSEMMRPNPEPHVAVFLDSIADEGIGIATVTVWEISDGIGRLDHGRHRDGLTKRFQDLLDELFEDQIVDWIPVDAVTCARTMEEKRRRGESLDDQLPDAILASMVAGRGLAIATRDVGEFRNTGVEFVDPGVDRRPLGSFPTPAPTG